MQKREPPEIMNRACQSLLAESGRTRASINMRSLNNVYGYIIYTKGSCIVLSTFHSHSYIAYMMFF